MVNVSIRKNLTFVASKQPGQCRREAGVHERSSGVHRSFRSLCDTSQRKEPDWARSTVCSRPMHARHGTAMPRNRTLNSRSLEGIRQGEGSGGVTAEVSPSPRPPLPRSSERGHPWLLPAAGRGWRLVSALPALCPCPSPSRGRRESMARHGYLGRGRAYAARFIPPRPSPR